MQPQVQILTSSSEKILCYYMNATNCLQIIQTSNQSDCPFQQIVFPGQQILFEAYPETTLNILSQSTVHESSPHPIKCSYLQVDQGFENNQQLECKLPVSH